MKRDYPHCNLQAVLIKYYKIRESPITIKRWSSISDSQPESFKIGDARNRGGAFMKKLTVTMVIAISIFMASVPAFGE
ncbi:MAG: hypothetical protein ACXWL9_04640, partial [Syntrophales bacterium]